MSEKMLGYDVYATENYVNEKLAGVGNVLPDWNLSDETAPDYIKNRPFYESDVLAMTDILEWDGDVNAEGLIKVGRTMEYYKVSDIVLETSDLIGGYFKLIQSNLTEILEDDLTETEDVIVRSNAFIIAKKDNISYSGMTFPEKGIYFFSFSNNRNLTTIYLRTTSNIFTANHGEIKQIEAKYLFNSNILNGKKTGAIRTIGTAEEDSDYELGEFAFAEGSGTRASGDWSHAEGSYTIASGRSSHAEGSSTKAYGSTSHAEGSYTIASSFAQHVQGKYNIEDADSKYAHIVGNGTASNRRSNIHTLDWDGNAWYQGDIYVGSTSGTNKDEGSKKLATEEYVATELANLVGTAPETLDTIEELATAFQENEDVIETLNQAIGSKADWNQSDSSAFDYIKNRTHYTESSNEIIVDNTHITLVKEYGLNVYTAPTLNFITPLVEGQEYTIIFDNVTYKCVCGRDGDGDLYLGNKIVVAGPLEWTFNDGVYETPQPFFISEPYGVYTKTEMSVDILILIQQEIIHKLDAKYLPDTVATKADLESINSNIKTVIYENTVFATQDGQTVFNIGIGSFDATTDSLNVHDGRLYLTRNLDYTVSGQTVTLTEGVGNGDSITFTVLKNVPVLEEEITISPSLLENGSIPLSKLASMPTADLVGTYTKAEVDAIVAAAVAAVKEEIMASLKVTADVPIHLGIGADGGLTITYDDGSVTA